MPIQLQSMWRNKKIHKINILGSYPKIIMKSQLSSLLIGLLLLDVSCVRSLGAIFFRHLYLEAENFLFWLISVAVSVFPEVAIYNFTGPFFLSGGG